MLKRSSLVPPSHDATDAGEKQDQRGKMHRTIGSVW